MTIEEQITLARKIFDFRFTDEDKTHEYELDLSISTEDAHNKYLFDLIRHQFESKLLTLYYEWFSENHSDEPKPINFLNYQLSRAINKKELLKIVSEYIRRKPTGSEFDDFFFTINYWCVGEKFYIDSEEARLLGIPFKFKTPSTLLPLDYRSRLSLNQVALLYVYNNEVIAKDNHNEIAEWYGYSSGHKLIQLYSQYLSLANRTGTEGSKKKTENKIQLLESMLSLVNNENKAKVIEELNKLQQASIDAFP